MKGERGDGERGATREGRRESDSVGATESATIWLKCKLHLHSRLCRLDCSLAEISIQISQLDGIGWAQNSIAADESRFDRHFAIQCHFGIKINRPHCRFVVSLIGHAHIKIGERFLRGVPLANRRASDMCFEWYLHIYWFVWFVCIRRGFVPFRAHLCCFSCGARVGTPCELVIRFVSLSIQQSASTDGKLRHAI